MVVIALDCGCGLLEADVVKAGEGSPTDVLDGVIRNQKLLLRKMEPQENITGDLRKHTEQTCRMHASSVLLSTS